MRPSVSSVKRASAALALALLWHVLGVQQRSAGGLIARRVFANDTEKSLRRTISSTVAICPIAFILRRTGKSSRLNFRSRSISTTSGQIPSNIWTRFLIAATSTFKATQYGLRRPPFQRLQEHEVLRNRGDMIYAFVIGVTLVICGQNAFRLLCSKHLESLKSEVSI
jgi:hypothetical protein